MHTLPATATPHPHQSPHLPNPPSSPEPIVLSSSPRPGTSRLPRPRRWGRGSKLLAALAALLVLGGIATGAWVLTNGKGGPRPDLLLHQVKYEKLQVMIVERGALESAENADIVCRVKAGAKGGTVASTIKWVIDAGAEVKAGDKLVELDDSGLQEQLKSQKITMDTAQANWIQAEEAYKITESQNTSDIASARLTLDLKKIALRNYLEGEYEQKKRDIEGRMLMAQSDLEMWEERSAWSTRMSRPGRRYVTAAQAESDAARKVSSQISLKNVQEELRVLEDAQFGTKVQKVKTCQGDIDEAVRALDRVQKQAKAKEVQADADRKSKLSIYEQAVSAYQDIEEEIRKCQLYAPHAGMVVYYVPEQSRFGQGSQQSIVAQGEPVREGQKLMRIPDLTKMLVNTRVHEAMISRVRGEQWQKTGFSESVQAGLCLAPDLFTRLVGERVLTLDRANFAENWKAAELRLVGKGQRARVRVDSFASKSLKGHVKTVATVASQQDFLSADVKVYQTMVSIDEPLEGLRPDMSAEVTIYTDNQRNHVLTMPLQAVVASAALNNTRKCFVMRPEGPVEREITLGMSNDKMVEVRSGLEEGDQVVINPRLLLSEKDKAAAGGYGKQPGQGEGASPDAGKEGWSGGGEGKKGPPGGWDGKKGLPGAGEGQKAWPGAGEGKKAWPGGGDKKGEWKKGGPPAKSEGE
jgi:HlyD family secretion protein